jgi:hypothetical protein
MISAASGVGKSQVSSRMRSWAGCLMKSFFFKPFVGEDGNVNQHTQEDHWS